MTIPPTWIYDAALIKDMAFEAEHILGDMEMKSLGYYKQRGDDNPEYELRKLFREFERVVRAHERSRCVTAGQRCGRAICAEMVRTLQDTDHGMEFPDD